MKNTFQMKRAAACTIAAALLVLVACGGGGGGGSSRSAPAYELGGTVSGLDEGYVDIRNGLDVRRVSAAANGLGLDQEFAFDTPLPAGVGYDVQIASDPAQFGLQCVLESAQGVMPTRTVSSVAVRCARIRSVRLLAGALALTGSRDGLAQQAVFNQPHKLALDAAGNLYVAEGRNLRRITPAGAVTTIRASGLPIEGVAADSTGNIYTSTDHAILRTTPLGATGSYAGLFSFFGNTDGPAGGASFTNPTAMLVGPGDQLYVLSSGISNSVPGAVRRISPLGMVSTVSLPFMAEQLRGLALDAAGYAYTCQPQAGGSISVLRTSPTATATVGGFLPSTSTACSGLAVDSAGRIHIADGDFVHTMTPSGQVTSRAGFGLITGMVIDNLGRLLLSTPNDNTVRMLTPAGAVSIYAGLPHTSVNLAGHDDGSAGTARFNRPSGIALDASGNLYVADTDNHLIRRITPSGVVTTLAGAPGISGHVNGAAGSARFHTPTAVAVDSAGNVWVTELGNRTLRRITPSGTVSTVAGHHTLPVTSTDGTGPTASFIAPSGLTLDANGDVIVIDDTVVRRVTPAGVVTTLTTPSTDGTGIAVNSRGIMYTGGGALWQGGRPQVTRSATILTTGIADAMATGPDGEIYYASRGRNVVYRLDHELLTQSNADYTIQIEAGQTGEPNAAIGPLPGAVGSIRGLAVNQRRVYFTTDNAVLFFDR